MPPRKTDTDTDPELEAMLADAPEERLHPILSNEEYRAAQAAAKKRVEDERRKAAMKAVQAEEESRLKYEEGLVSGIATLDEMVDINIDLPPWSNYLSVNGSNPGGRVYHHGKTYTVPRHVAMTLQEMMFRAWRHEDQIDGRDIHQTYQRKLNSTLNGRTGAVHNAPTIQ